MLVKLVKHISGDNLRMRVAQFQTVDPFTSTRAENLALALGGGNDHPVTPLTRTFFPVVPFSVSYVCDTHAIVVSVKKYRTLVPMVLFRVTGQTHGYDLGARQRAVTVCGLRQTVFYDVIQAIYLVPEDMRFLSRRHRRSRDPYPAMPNVRDDTS